MFTYPLGFFADKEDTTFKIVLDMTTPSTAGIELEFTGTVFIDWKDGGGQQALTSGVELEKTYTVPAIYEVELHGDLELVTQFLMANSKIKGIINFKTGNLTVLNINANLIDSLIDLSYVNISNSFQYYSNTSASFIFGNNGNLINFRNYSAGIVGVLDLSSFTFGAAAFSQMRMENNPAMSGMLLAETGHTKVDNFNIYGTSFQGVLDFKDLGTQVFLRAYNLPNLNDIIFSPVRNGVINSFELYGCNFDYLNFTTHNFNADNGSLLLQDNSMGVSDVNHILVDLAGMVSLEGVGGDYTGRVINIGGTNDAPDSSSGGYDGIAAVSTLQSKGFTVITS